jgi:L-asparaginase
VIVELLTTGGTVATTAINGRSAPTLDAEDLGALVAVPGILVETRELDRRPSWALDPADMAAIALAARDRARERTVAGVVVTHGTTTLEYTAFLADLFLDVDTPVVLTGAMRRADDPDPDGPANLNDAVRVAGSTAARGAGALVVFAGRIIPGRSAWKAQRIARDAFVGAEGDAGSVSAAGVRLERRPGRDRPFSGRLETRVGFVKVVPGADHRPIDAALAGDVLGLVVEGLPGQGGIPPGMQPAVAQAAARVPVVLASRAPFGELSDLAAGGTGEPLRDVGLLSAGALSAEHAWLLLMAVLADEDGPESARRRFAAAATGRSDDMPAQPVEGSP